VSDAPQLATFTGHAPRYFPVLGRVVEPGDEVEITAALAAEYDDLFRPADKAKATAKAPAPASDKEAS
jgi:hypothetical protein